MGMVKMGAICGERDGVRIPLFKGRKTCRKLERMAMKMPFCLRADQLEVIEPITGRQAEKAAPKREEWSMIRKN